MVRRVLKEKRLLKGYESVPEFAALLDISTSFYYKIERGTRNPTIELAKKIADLLDDTVDNLFCAHELDDSSNNLAV